MSNLRQITAASLLYGNEHKGTYPTQGKQPNNSSIYWFYKIAPELGMAEADLPPLGNMDPDRDLGVLQCPSALAQHTPGNDPINNRVRTYSMNEVLSGIDASQSSNGSWSFPGIRSLKAVNPAKTAFYMDGHLDAPNSPYWKHTMHPVNMSSIKDNFVHKGPSINVSYLDGHVGRVTAEQVTTDHTDIFWNPLATR